jgi:thiamine-phosphate pyrophosphorylase
MIDFNLYLITDRIKVDCDLREAITQALIGGVRAIQIREKDLPIRELLQLAKDLRTITRRFGARLFINDRLDVAMAVNADGIHLGQTSFPVDAVRQVVGSSMMIGSSTHSLQEAYRAKKGGADFITVGPVYDTPSKRAYGLPLGLDRLDQIVKSVDLPVFAIGGIGRQNLRELAVTKITGVAVISSILCTPSISDAARQMALELHSLQVGYVDHPTVQ